LLQLGAQQKGRDTVSGDLSTVLETIKASRELRSLLQSPIITKKRKKSVLAEIFKKKTGTMVRQYLGSIIDKGREDLLDEILEHYFLLRDEQMGIVRVNVRTAVKFSPKQEKDLMKQLESLTQKTIQIAFSLDTSLKGGFVATVGDTTFDGSVKRQLELLRTYLQESSVLQN
jgi:F-type H+-transporting ATPase subunit delta